MAAFLKKLRHANAAFEQEVVDDPAKEDRVDEPEIHYTNADSTLVFRMSLPSLKLDTVLTFEIGPCGSLKRVQEYMDFLFDGITTELAEDIGEECPGASQEQFRSFIESAESRMDEWQMRLKKADESVFRAERLKAELVRMREAYHKDLMGLRQQLSNAAKKENENGFDLDVVMSFDARLFMQEEEQMIADLQTQIAQQAKSSSRMIRGLESDLECLNDRLATKDLLSERQGLLIESMQKEQGEMTEQMAAQLQDAMSAKEAEYAARSAELKSALETKHCTKCRARIDDSPPASPRSPERTIDRKAKYGWCALEQPAASDLPDRPFSQAEDRPSGPEMEAPAELKAEVDDMAIHSATSGAGRRGSCRKKTFRRKGLADFLDAQKLQEVKAYAEPGGGVFNLRTKSTTSTMAQTEVCSDLLDKAQRLLGQEAEGGELQRKSSIGAGSEDSGTSQKKVDDCDTKANYAQKPKPGLMLDMMAAPAVIKNCQLQPGRQKEVPDKLEKQMPQMPVGASRTEGDLPLLAEPPSSARGSRHGRAPLRRPVPNLTQTGRLQSVWSLQADQSVNDSESLANMRALPAFPAGSKKISAKPVPKMTAIAPARSVSRRCSNEPLRDHSPDLSRTTSFQSSAAPSHTASYPVQRNAFGISPGNLREIARAQQDADDDSDSESDVLSVVSSGEEMPASPSGSNDPSMMALPALREDIRQPPISSRSAKVDVIERFRRPPSDDRSYGA